jgi:hypothetical protein
MNTPIEAPVAVVFVPGFLGTKAYQGERCVWPELGALREGLFAGLGDAPPPRSERPSTLGG